MSNSSSSKLGGQCLVVGGILSFLVFIIQILVSGPPPGNEHIFTYFANEIAKKIIVGQIGFMIATSMDVAIIYAQDPIETAGIASRQMSVFFMFGPVTFLGAALVSLNLASREYINALYARITAVVFLIVILAMFYSSINLADPGNHNIPSTIMPAFAGISIAQFFAVIWNLMVGMKMMKN